VKFPPWWGSGYFLELHNVQLEKRKMRQGKRKKEGRRESKIKSQDCFVTFKPKKPNLEFLLSARAQTSQANILFLYMDQKAGKCMTCKCLCNKF